MREGGPGGSTDQPACFFYVVLGSGDQDEIIRMFGRLRKEVKTLIRSVVEMVYFMRGSIQYDDLMFRTPGERAVIQEFLDERFETEKKREHPVY